MASPGLRAIGEGAEHSSAVATIELGRRRILAEVYLGLPRAVVTPALEGGDCLPRRSPLRRAAPPPGTATRGIGGLRLRRLARELSALVVVHEQH